MATAYFEAKNKVNQPLSTMQCRDVHRIFQRVFPKGKHACDTLRWRVCMVRASPVHVSPSRSGGVSRNSEILPAYFPAVLSHDTYLLHMQNFHVDGYI